MLTETLNWLSDNEPLISAFVGLFTICAGTWGVLSLLLHHRKLSGNLGTVPDKKVADSNPPSPKPRIVHTLINLGVKKHSGLEELISVRTINIALIALLLVSLAWVVASLVSRNAISLTIIHVSVLIATLGVYRLQTIGKTEFARWCFVVLTAIYWMVILVLAGPMRSVEYALPILLMINVLIFGKRESWKLLFSSGLVLFALLAAIVLQRIIPPLDFGDDLQLLVNIAYYLNLVLMSAVSFFLINFYNNIAADSFDDLESQKQKTDELVNRILPEYVAKRVQNREALVADWHREATVMIATINGFDTLSNKISAAHLVEVLGEIFLQFDQIVNLRKIEKVNNLDTTYVVATGIGESGESDHEAIASFGIDALKAVKRISESTGHPLSFRAGISTGHVVSGVIGNARPCFDIWGATVELANSMRDSAMDDSIVVDEPTYWRLKGKFEFAAIEDSSGNYLLLRENETSAS